MTLSTAMDQGRSGRRRDAARFWEPLRLWYSGVLALVPYAWIAFSWPHFRGSVGLFSLWLLAFLALANVAYCAGYIAEAFLQALVPQNLWRRIRQVLWGLGMVLALLVENYWIADEIYPYPNTGQASVASAGSHFASNINFPAPLAVLGFVGAMVGLFAAMAAVLIFWFARKPKFARGAAITIGVGAVIYLGLLVGFSAASHSTTLALGQEKYFCEIDCHLAYAVVDVKSAEQGGSAEYRVTLRTRFDAATISASRPKDAPLLPSPREVRLVDHSGHSYAPVSSGGASLMTPLRPGESYTTELEFRVPAAARGLRLLLNTVPAWPDRVVIGDENSWGHRKTYFAL